MKTALSFKCPACGKRVEETKRYRLGAYWSLTLSCGHTTLVDALAAVPQEIDSWEKFKSVDGRSLYPFQKIGADFAIEANGRCLIADEMGLGKTIQALAVMWQMKDAVLPALVVTKSTLKYQWSHEIYRFLGETYVNQVIENKNQKPLTEFGFKVVIISFDMLRRCEWVNDEAFMKNRFKLLVIDETQNIKNPSASRTGMVRKIAKYCPHVIGLSGTPIKNNAAEYYTILNILKPERFQSYKDFLYNYVNTYDSGYGTKSGGLRDPEYFHTRTKDFIIRREMKEVMPELPEYNRTFRYAELGEQVEEAYSNLMDKFEQAYNDSIGNPKAFMGVLEYMTHMKHLTGIAKVEPVADFVTDFLNETERKITVFIHHQDVHKLIHMKLQTVCDELGITRPLALTSDLSPEQRHEVVMQFKNDDKARVMIASTLASGEGLNLQFCSDAVIVERQWNPANEEQAEARFKRIGSLASTINITYQVAIGTIDEFLAELVEKKREIVKEALSGKVSEVRYDEQGILRELADILANKGKNRWRLGA